MWLTRKRPAPLPRATFRDGRGRPLSGGVRGPMPVWRDRTSRRGQYRLVPDYLGTEMGGGTGRAKRLGYRLCSGGTVAKRCER